MDQPLPAEAPGALLSAPPGAPLDEPSVGYPGAGDPPQHGPVALVPAAPAAPPPQSLESRRPALLSAPPPEEPRQRNRFWAAIKWPLRKLLLLIYLVVSAIRRHTRESLIIGGLLLALIITGVVVYGVTRPAPPPVAVEQPVPPALPASVIHYLHASQHFDGAEMWNSLDPSARTQLKATKEQLQATLNQEKAAGLTIDRFVYSGGYRSPDGTGHYTIEVYASEQGQSGAFTWFFTVGANGLITQRLDLTQ